MTQWSCHGLGAVASRDFHPVYRVSRGVLMPLFEYKCRKCSHEFEALVVGSRRPVCPKCKSDDLEKKVSSFGMGAGLFGGWSRPSSGCGSSGGG